MPAATTPMMTTTTRSSTSVKPAAGGSRRAGSARLVADIPVADVGIDAFTTRCTVGAEAGDVVFLAVGAGIDVLIVISPRILGDALDVAPGAPVLDGRIRRLRDERLQALLGGRIVRVVEPEHGERGLYGLDVALRLGDLGVIHLADHGRDDHRG